MPGLYYALRPLASTSRAPHKTPKPRQQVEGYFHEAPPLPTTTSVHSSAACWQNRPRIHTCAQPTCVSSSGSSHDPSSACLAALVHGFMEEGGLSKEGAACGRSRCNCTSGSCSGEEQSCRKEDEEEQNHSHSSIGEEFPEILEGIVSCRNGREAHLLSEVAKAVEGMRERHGDIRGLQRGVMSELRRMGYNSGICKSRWDESSGLPAGTHEYMDVIITQPEDGKPDRYILDLDFKPHFQIARPTHIYLSYVNALPPIFLGRPEKLQQVLKIMSEAVKCSLRKRGLHIPPWRKLSYMQAKWLSSYKRTTNEEPHNHHHVAVRGPQLLLLLLCPTPTSQAEEEGIPWGRMGMGSKAADGEGRGEKRRGRLVSGIAGALKSCRSDERAPHTEQEREGVSYLRD